MQYLAASSTIDSMASFSLCDPFAAFLQGDDKPLHLKFGITIIGKGGEDDKIWRTAQKFEEAVHKTRVCSMSEAAL
jgi:hypothetical protein